MIFFPRRQGSAMDVAMLPSRGARLGTAAEEAGAASSLLQCHQPELDAR